jgi:hypothetical protein
LGYSDPPGLFFIFFRGPKRIQGLVTTKDAIAQCDPESLWKGTVRPADQDKRFAKASNLELEASQLLSTGNVPSDLKSEIEDLQSSMQRDLVVKTSTKNVIRFWSPIN